VLLEGWVKRRDFGRLKKVVGKFGATSVDKIDVAEGEVIPVEIDNNAAVRPFEMVTRLYGMPDHFDVDPTMFLAPFFALFFGLCLTDAGYGLVMVGIFAYIAKKMQGDKKLMWMLVICSVMTVIAGAATGSWFGNAIQEFVPGLDGLRKMVLWFDPLEKPMTFFVLSLGLGYLQIMVGIAVALGRNILRRDYVAAVCDQLTWLILLNSLAVFGAGKFGAINPSVAGVFGKIAIVPAIMIVLFSERDTGLGGRLGMGAYQLFSTIFFLGDVLSYLRLMALGMVTAGLGMAFNVIAKMAGDLLYIGWLVGAIVFIIGHSFNLILSGLSAFVHTLRLQFVEFFPKFLAGGGLEFKPLSKGFKHVYVEEEK
jgi:V/A-type H+-transporting ATPase subunit I